MKKQLLQAFVTIGFLSTALPAGAQSGKGAWAADINVAPVSGEQYKNARISAGSDGAIYVGRLVRPAGSNTYNTWRVERSTDTGRTWTSVATSFVSGAMKYSAFDMMVAGTGADYKLFVARATIDTGTFAARLILNSYTSTGGSAAGMIDESYTAGSSRGYMTVALANDYRDKNSYATTYTVSMAAGKASNSDSLIAFSMQNTTAMLRRSLYGTAGYIRNVSAAVGSALSTLSTAGRLGIAWDEFTTSSAAFGAVKAQFLFPYDLTLIPANAAAPVQMGSSSATDKRNPSIVLSQNTAYGNIRAMVAYEYNTGSGQPYIDTRSDTLYPTSHPVAFTQNKNLPLNTNDAAQPHLMYDPVYDNILAVYYDLQSGAIPYLVESYTTYNNFSAVKANMRDATSTTSSEVYPRVDINTVAAQGTFAWNDNGSTMFDAEYHIQPSSISNTGIALADAHLYPNPAHSGITLRVSAGEAAGGTLSIVDMSGRQVHSQAMSVTKGINEVTIPLSNLPAGNYLLRIDGEHIAASFRFVVN